MLNLTAKPRCGLKTLLLTQIKLTSLEIHFLKKFHHVMKNFWGFLNNLELWNKLKMIKNMTILNSDSQKDPKKAQNLWKSLKILQNCHIYSITIFLKFFFENFDIFKGSHFHCKLPTHPDFEFFDDFLEFVKLKRIFVLFFESIF